MIARRATGSLAWATHDKEWRDVAAVSSQWSDATSIDPALARGRARGRWWEVLAEQAITLLISREYEHLLIAMSAGEDGPRLSYFPLPHPSGIAVDRRRGVVHVASTRNPNQVFDFAPVERLRSRPGVNPASAHGRPLVPVQSHFFPGCLYLHDLAMIGPILYGSATGENSIVELGGGGQVRRAWWPKCIETRRGPLVERNHLQLNGIGAGKTIRASYFSASSSVPSRRRPGHRNFPVDGLGVVLSGATRKPVLRGLTRPHSVRLQQGRLWVANSGYGEVGVERDGRFDPIVTLPGWTRGLCFNGRIAFAGTSHVIPRFRAYAPGVDASRSVCGVHAIDTRSGEVLGSFVWPAGYQVFAIEGVPAAFTEGFPFPALGPRRPARQRDLFQAFIPATARRSR